MSIDDIQLRLEEIATELWAPDQEARELRDQIAATYQRRGGKIHLDLADAVGIAERRRLYVPLDENSHRYGAMRAERKRLQLELRRLTKGDALPARNGRRAA